jgi:hypothetical protein
MARIIPAQAPGDNPPSSGSVMIGGMTFLDGGFVGDCDGILLLVGDELTAVLDVIVGTSLTGDILGRNVGLIVGTTGTVLTKFPIVSQKNVWYANSSSDIVELVVVLLNPANGNSASDPLQQVFASYPGNDVHAQDTILLTILAVNGKSEKDANDAKY